MHIITAFVETKLSRILPLPAKKTFIRKKASCVLFVISRIDL